MVHPRLWMTPFLLDNGSFAHVNNIDLHLPQLTSYLLSAQYFNTLKASFLFLNNSASYHLFFFFFFFFFFIHHLPVTDLPFRHACFCAWALKQNINRSQNLTNIFVSFILSLTLKKKILITPIIFSGTMFIILSNFHPLMCSVSCSYYYYYYYYYYYHHHYNHHYYYYHFMAFWKSQKKKKNQNVKPKLTILSVLFHSCLHKSLATWYHLISFQSLHSTNLRRR